MDAPLVSCQGCSRTWHSRTMADGLRAIRHCPRCSGELVWAADAASVAALSTTPAASTADVAPHLVLGLPRR